MEHNPPTAGDYAASMASDNRFAIKRLEARVAALENHNEYLVRVLNKLIDSVYDDRQLEILERAIDDDTSWEQARSRLNARGND